MNNGLTSTVTTIITQNRRRIEKKCVYSELWTVTANVQVRRAMSRDMVENISK